MKTVIVPCAGKSSRFPTSKPKWLLTHPNGELMLIASLRGLKWENNLGESKRFIVTLVKNHIVDNNINLEEIKKDFSNLEFLILDDFTQSQAETVYTTIKKLNITGSIFIKDCDNYFTSPVTSNNCVCVSNLQEDTVAVNKSYIYIDKFGFLSGIVEKQVIGDKFCVGGYSFNDSEEFCKSFEELKKIKSIDIKEIYISHVIQHMLLAGKQFAVQDVENYIDWGTWKDWKKYCDNFSSIFIDLDGVLVENSGQYTNPQWGTTSGLTNNIKTINNLYTSGKHYIIITTSRKSYFGDATKKQLFDLGILYHKIIFGLPHSKRILINDFAETNEYPSAIAISIARNCDDLNKYLKE